MNKAKKYLEVVAEDCYLELAENPDRYRDYKGDEQSLDSEHEYPQKVLGAVASDAFPVTNGGDGATSRDLMKHDLKYHGGHYDPQKGKCKYRKEHGISDNPGTGGQEQTEESRAEGDRADADIDSNMDENGHPRVDVAAVTKRVQDYFAKAGITSDSPAFQAYMECGSGFCNAPASTRFHLSTKGGLAQHSLNVCDNMLKISGAMGVKWPRPESPYLIGLLHDACKCYTYKPNTAESFEERKKSPYLYNESPYKGHGDASVQIAKDLGFKLLPEEEDAIKWHMGAWGLDKDGMGRYNDAIDKNPMMHICVHTADMMAAKSDEQNT